MKWIKRLWAAGAGMLIQLAAAAASDAFIDTENSWYQNLQLPYFMPGVAAYDVLWTGLFLTGTAAIAAIFETGRGKYSYMLLGVSLLLYVAAAAVFFKGHSPLAALIIMSGALTASVMLEKHSFKHSAAAGLLYFFTAAAYGYYTALLYCITMLN